MSYQDDVLALMKAQADGLKGLAEQMQAQTALLATMSRQIERLEWLVAPAGPNYTHPLAAYAGFDWARIGAEVVASDRQGAARVDWFGRTFTRRSGAGKFGQAIWFSRFTGEDESGQKTYARLVTFKDYAEAEPVNRDVADQVNGRK